MKYKTQIEKYQNAGSIPAVNEYGLTEEDMSSVRDNMRRYGLSEEEAIRNRIMAKETSANWINETMANLDGSIGDAYRRANEAAQVQKQFGYLPKVEIPQLVNNGWKYQMLLNLQKGMFDVDRSMTDTKALSDWYTTNEAKAGREPSSQYIRDLRNNALAGLSQRYKDFDNYRQEYLSHHPAPSMEELVVRGTNPSPWDYRPDINREEKAYQYARKLSEDWAPSGTESPLKQWNDAVKDGTKVGIGATLALSTLPMFGSEFATYGLAGGVPRIIGGFAGSAIGEKGLGFLGKKLDSAFNTKWIEPAARFAGGWIGWGKGANLAYKGALKGTNLAMRTAANKMMRNGAYDVTFQPKRWLIGNQMQADLKLMNAGIDPIKNPISLNKLYNLVGAYNRPNPSKLITATAYKQGGIIKNQIGGLVYKPYIPEQNESEQTSSTTLSYEPEEQKEEFFEVSPVRIYGMSGSKPRQQEEPVQEEPMKDFTYEPEDFVDKPVADFTDNETNVLYNDGSNEDKRRASIKYLQKELSLTAEQAAAIVGQWQRESGFKLNAENKEEKAGKNSSVKRSQYGIGIGQWTGDRHDAFVKYVKTHGGIANLKTQLDFAIEEIKSNPDFLNNLRSAKTLKDASAYVYAQYVAAQHKGIKSLDDLYSRVHTITENYRKKHREMYGRSSDTFNIGLRNAEDSLKLLY